MNTLTESEGRFVRAAVRRKRLFLILSVLGVVIGLGFAGFVAYRRARNPELEVGVRLAVVMLILLVVTLNVAAIVIRARLRKRTQGSAF